jgi:carboxymethylenebutenolidase
MTDKWQNAEIWAEHLRSTFEAVEQVLRAMTAERYVNHLPTMISGFGVAEVKRFYRDHFIGPWPSGTTITPISRTLGDGQIVDKTLIGFTHHRIIDYILSGVAPTGRKIEMATVPIVRSESGKIACEYIHRDRASVLVQAGLTDPEVLPIADAEVPATSQDPALPTDTLIQAVLNVC